MPPQNPYEYQGPFSGQIPQQGPTRPDPRRIPRGKGYYIPGEPSPLGKLARLPGDIVSDTAGVLRDIGKWATTGTPERYFEEPTVPPPSGLIPSGPRAPRPPSLEEMREAPYGQVATTPSYPGGSDLGTAIYEGPRLNTEESLAGLRSAQPQFPRSFEPSTEELYRHAGLPSETVAPGSQAQMGAMLQGRIGDEAYGDLQQRKQLEMIQASLASLHPGVQRAAELEAQRRALPAEVAGRAQLQGSLAAAESRRDVAGMNLQRGDLAAQLQQAGQLAQAIARIQAKTNQSDEDRALVQQLYGLYTALITDAYGGEEDYEEEVP